MFKICSAVYEGIDYRFLYTMDRSVLKGNGYRVGFIRVHIIKPKLLTGIHGCDDAGGPPSTNIVSSLGCNIIDENGR